MVRFNQVEKVVEKTEGEYLFKIYECNEKTSQNGNDYFQVKFKTDDEFKVCDNFMFTGKAASKTLGLLNAIGIGDGENWEEIGEITPNHLLGLYLYISVKKDGDFFKCPFNRSGYRAFESQPAKPEPKKADKAPF